jgi:serine/threonine protein kinase
MATSGEGLSIEDQIFDSGAVIGGFRIDALIGVGGMAVVYRAEQLSLERAVALKVLGSQFSDNAVFRTRFDRECKIAAALDHPNIVPVYDCGEANGRLFLAMQLIDRITLGGHLERGALTIAETMAVLTPIADALDVAHAAGLVHRDIKPQNILIAVSGRPYLADFGIAKSSDSQRLTDTGQFLGTLSYASPEQIRGTELTGASDVYGFAGVLFHCLTGRAPYSGGLEQVMRAHLDEPAPEILEDELKGQRETSPINAVIARGMAKDPARRFGSARELVISALGALGQPPLPVPASPSSGTSRSYEGASVPAAAERPVAIPAARGTTHAATTPNRLPRRLIGALVSSLVVGLAVATLAGGFAGGSRHARTVASAPSSRRSESALPLRGVRTTTRSDGKTRHRSRTPSSVRPHTAVASIASGDASASGAGTLSSDTTQLASTPQASDQSPAGSSTPATRPALRPVSPPRQYGPTVVSAPVE